MTNDETTTHRLTLLGAGVMGVGIAALALGHGVPVVLIDVDPARLDRARGEIDREVRRARLMGALPAGRVPGELRTGTSVAAAADSTAVVEAVTERADLKVKALTEAAATVGDGAPLISNTSSIPIGELAAELPRPEALVGTHFMNPPSLIRQVEVIRGPDTGEAAMAAVTALLAAMERRAVVVRDAPGFVTSRVLHPMINDAIRVLAAGTASAAAIDTLMEGCLGHPMGPLRTADLIGLDNLADSLTVLHERTSDARCAPCGLLLEKVRDGHLGRKSGRGFFEYTEAGA
ncbi:3-hydroxyacyl-CoA dehydrogenase family protein [Actinomadura sp. 9N215]|uniref:3-hydroxyacyl-CoA dehydrogenase family protein n=1 Tax=Actinomadura sp. 9N215 TaxID=3375150 RepID=UPI0037B78B53